MSKAAKIRDALPPGTELNRSGMLDATGIPDKRLDAVLYAFTARGEVLVRDKAGEPHYRIDPDYKRGTVKKKKAAGTGPKKAAKKKSGKKKERAVRKSKDRPFRDLADRYTAKHKKAAERLRELALDNYLVASAELRKVVRDQVEAIEGNPALAAAVAAHERAEGLHAAARSA